MGAGGTHEEDVGVRQAMLGCRTPTTPFIHTYPGLELVVSIPLHAGAGAAAGARRGGARGWVRSMHASQGQDSSVNHYPTASEAAKVFKEAGLGVSGKVSWFRWTLSLP